MKYKCETCFKWAEPGDEWWVCAGSSTQPFTSQLQLIIYDFHNMSCDLGAQKAPGAGRAPPQHTATSASPILTGSVPIATRTALRRIRPQFAITAGSLVWSPVSMGGIGWQWVSGGLVNGGGW